MTKISDSDEYSAQKILEELIKCPSVTPQAGSCFDYLEKLLRPFGFVIERKIFQQEGELDVENFYARWGRGQKHFMFAGHVDVVPPGPENLWTYPPFSAQIADGICYGRGAVDMKGGVAGFIAAAISYIKGRGDCPSSPQAASKAPCPEDISISIALTGDEESVAINGTVKLLAWLYEKGERWDGCLLGEPTSSNQLGDYIKIGRRGSLSGKLTITGRQGHVAYPEKCHNPIPALVFILEELRKNPIDKGTEHFQPSNLEITNIHSDNKATNVIAQEISASFNIRYNSLWQQQSLSEHMEKEIHKALAKYQETGPRYAKDSQLKIAISWQKAPVDAFFSENPALIGAISQAIYNITGQKPQASTHGGSSDARFIKDYCPVLEFGPCGSSMHQIDEHIPLSELALLSDIYREFLTIYFT